MTNPTFEILKENTQKIIDLIASKNYNDAAEMHTTTSELLDEILDHLEDDADLVTISKYQVLLNKLYEQMEEQ